MKRILILLLLGLVAVPFLAYGKPKKQKATLPAVFDQARYVYVEAYNGDRFNPDLRPEDRQAIFDVEKGLHEWNRYALAQSRGEAELVFMVRKGRLASADAHAGINIPSRAQDRNAPQRDPTQDTNGQGVGVGTEVGRPDDSLSVYMVSPSGSLNGPIWSQSLADGLSAPFLLLLRQIKHEVETAYPK
jgi:hypothetical protein